MLLHTIICIGKRFCNIPKIFLSPRLGFVAQNNFLLLSDMVMHKGSYCTVTGLQADNLSFDFYILVAAKDLGK